MVAGHWKDLELHVATVISKVMYLKKENRFCSIVSKGALSISAEFQLFLMVCEHIFFEAYFYNCWYILVK